MTVGELIKSLEFLPDDTRVRIKSGEYMVEFQEIRNISINATLANKELRADALIEV